MKTRVIVSVILIPLLLIVLLALPKVIAAVLCGAMAFIAAYELLYTTGYVRNLRLMLFSMVMAFLVCIWSYTGMNYAAGLLGLLIFFALLFAEMMLSHGKLHFDKVAYCMAAGLLIPFLLSSLLRILAVEGTGRYFILMPFIIAFMSDSGAYFAGSFLGKHKLAPAISPQKTIEGAIGGLLCAVLGMLLYGLILDLAFDFTVRYGACVLYAVLGSAGGVFGDLCFSVIKRQTGIKDYGNLIPGHGGILDRFDSMMIVAPLVEALLVILPLAVK